MQALCYPDWDTLSVQELPRPSPGPADILLRVAACGICGSELETFKTRSARRTPPLVMGHEFCGTVEAVGESVKRFAEGARVVSNSVVPCGDCVRCSRGDSHLCEHRQIFGMHRPGAFAEFVVVPERCLIEWPASLMAEEACLAEPLANGVHVYNLTQHLPIETVLVIGAGPIGLMCQQVQQVLAGATVFVSDVIEERRQTALALGAKSVFDPLVDDIVVQVRALTGGEGVDLVIDAVGSQATKQQSIVAARPGGAIVWIGLHEVEVSINSYGVTLAERTIYGTYAASLSELKQALALMAAGSVDARSWVGSFPLFEGVSAFRRMLAARHSDIKGVLVPSGRLTDTNQSVNRTHNPVE